MSVPLKIATGVVLLSILGFGSYTAAQEVSYHQPAFCSTVCHIMDPYYESFTSTSQSLLAHSHAESDVVCKDCHHTDIGQQMEEILAMVTGDYDTPMRERKISKDVCFACHEHESYSQLVELTSDLEPNPHDSHWLDLECRLCHKMHKPSVDYCDQCHDHGFVVP